LLQKHIRQRELSELSDQLVMVIASGYTTEDQLKAAINYIIQVGDTADPEAFLRSLANRLPQHEESLMTIAQKLEQKGEANGLKKGKLEVARTMFANGLDRATVMKMTGLSDKELAQICH
ncbi:Rpn family recombination-promoting nuclease/putative transposase, partial [Yersinia enterocolitica]|nr:Rpn family recombination-promoting nuclease/putative transposase [Yersinia enterocolitica]